jgi:RimJ/RimL family protein N-acetyltransferase
VSDVAPLDVDDDAELAAWHATYLAADRHGRVHPTPWMLEEMRADLRGRRTGERHLALAGRADGEIVSAGLVVLPLKENLDTAWGGVWTRPEHRGRGHGSAMAAALERLVRDEGRRTLTVEVFVPYDAPADGAGHPDVEFATRRGFELDLSNVVRVLDLPVDAARVQAWADEAAPHHRDYTLRQFRGPVPDDIVEPFGELLGSLMTEAPSGEVAREHEVMDVERIRADEVVFEASGRTKYTTVAVAPDGSLVAYSELVVPRHDPGHVYQWGTLVAPAHRGHRLGMATKAANLLWLQREEPGRTALVTVNAEVNAQMIGVNEALGFVPVERLVELHKRL